MRKKHIFILGLLAGFLALSQGVWALGLGKMTVHSPLGHPFSAQIELMGTKEEFADLKANIASPSVYQQRNLVYQAALARAQVTIERREDGSAYLKIVSSRVVAEPYLDVLVEASWPSGHALREYTVLLDPPKLGEPESIVPAQQATVAGRASAAPSPPAPSVSVASQESREQERQKRLRELQAKATGSAVHRSATGDNTYVVERGDTLTDIAQTFKPESVTMEQALIALYQANPQAFQGKNINRLRAGAVMEIPDDDIFTAVGQRQARQTIRVQVDEWRNYKRALAGVTPPPTTVRERTTDEGTIAPRPPSVGERPEGDRVVVSAGSGAGGSEDVSRRSQEQLASIEKALKDEKDRVKDLEGLVTKLQQSIEIKNRDMAEMQERAQKQIEELKKQLENQQRGASQQSPPISTTVTPAEPPAPPQPPPPPSQPPKPLPDETKVPAVVSPGSTVDQTRREEKPPVPPPPPARPAPSFASKMIGFLQDNLLLILGAVVIIGVLIGFVIYRRRRSESDALDSMFGATTTNGEMMTSSGSTFSSSSTAAQPPAPGVAPMGSRTSSAAVAPSNSILSEFSREGLGSIDTGEVDPLAEADVYLAYGRAQQAEEILQDALRRDNQRQDVYLKLLEVLAEQKKTMEFETAANQLHSLSGGQGDYWQRAVTIGQRLMPANPLFSGGRSSLDINDFMNQPTAVKTATSATEPLGFGAAAGTDPRGFSPMESESVAEAVARAASATMERRVLEESAHDADSDDGLTFDFDTPSQSSGNLGVDLDLEELSRFRNFGKAEEQVDISDTFSGTTTTRTPTTAPQPTTRTQQPTTTQQPPTTTRPTVTTGSPSSALGGTIDDIGLSLDESIIDDESVLSVGGAPFDQEGQWHDVATKLDLARAYQATGDIEACREILQEVLKEGDEQQKAEARGILQNL
ncbi:MAG: hypothetical protein LBS40_01195 [Burkholderiales bacterium]|nr:hypothetical protein [Burkholderiales bacterium]